MKDLTERQSALLMLIVRDYIETAQPVASQNLVSRYHLELSSATVRNEMAALTELGYLRQPHPSAGRVPTEEGYRFFVSRMVHQAELPLAVRQAIVSQFDRSRHDVEHWMRLAASILAHHSQSLSLITAPHAERVHFKHVELISTQGRQVLMVLVLVGGEVSQQILTLNEPVPQERLSAVAALLNQICRDRTVDELAALPARADALEKDILTLVLRDMRAVESRVSGEIYMDGLTNVLTVPEFVQSDEARRTLRLFAERDLLQDLLARATVDSNIGNLQVLIGGEGAWEELRQCSVVLARYGVPGQLSGTVGVLGPLRMPYARTIPTVRFMAGLLSDLMTDTIGGEKHDERLNDDPRPAA